MKALVRQLVYRARCLGWATSLGLVLLIVALVYGLMAWRAASARAERFAVLAARVNAEVSANTERAQAGGAGVAGPTTPAEQIGAFYKAFPKGESVPDWLESLYAIAENEKLALDAGEYLLTRGAGSRLDMFKITLPVKGSYPQLRKFIDSALTSIPALALDGLYLKREKVGDGAVNARIVFLLYLEKGA